jgi:hypothetical protein
MEKPPAGTSTGATPLGGGTAVALNSDSQNAMTMTGQRWASVGH